MLLGYREITGEIEFLFTDTAYLEKQFPKNSAKISNFWKVANHGLKEYFTDAKQFPDFYNYKFYKIIEGKIVKKAIVEIEKMNKPRERIRMVKAGSSAESEKLGGMVSPISPEYVKSLEDRIKKLEEQRK